MKRLSKLKNKILHKYPDNEPPADEAAGSPPAQPISVPIVTATAASAADTVSEPVYILATPLISDAPETSPSPLVERQMSTSERLWKKAYDSLDEPKVVEAYESVLQRVQQEWTTDTTPEELQHLEHCKTPRSRQMWMLVYSGLEKSKRQAKVKESISEIMSIIDSLKGVVDKAVKYSSEASIAWAGASLGLEILSNPMKEPGLNRKAIVYVLSRMEWYWNLVDLAIDQERTSMPSATLRSNLESQIVKFYKKLLLFQMHSACLYYRSWVSVLVRDLVKLDDWSDKLTEVKSAEDLLRKDMEQFCNEDTKSRLQGIETSSLSQAGSLEHIFIALREDAQLRQKSEQDDIDKECVAALFETDPRMDKRRLQRQKGDPLKESYEWIFRSEAYKSFMDNHANTVLWINGSPGKGKTMLVCGLVDELQKDLRPLSFFFCQASVKEEDRSSDIAVLRGLIYLLLEHQPSLISILRPYYDKQKERLFNSINSSEQLGEILGLMLQGPSLHNTILLVDALDECNKNRTKLTDLIIQFSGLSSIKWIISSRDWPEIRQDLAGTKGLVPLDLEREHVSVSGAVKSYINNRVDDLARKWESDPMLKEEVLHYMESHAKDTFLWVALVCEKLRKSPKRRVLEELRQFPPSLTALYQAMMDRITVSSEADRLKQILATVCIAHRPLAAEEIPTLVESMAGYDEGDVEDAIGSCGSFLTYEDGEIIFVHESAREFLLDQGQATLFPFGRNHLHEEIFSRCLDAMENTLKQDIYKFGSPGAHRTYKSPKPDPLGPIRYSCVYWAQHLRDSDPKDVAGIAKLERVLGFLQTKFTFWLEALSLNWELSTAITSISIVDNALGNSQMEELSDFIRDARQFITRHEHAIERTPLQVYASALIFSPQSSVIRKQFSHQVPEWVARIPEMQEQWDAHVQTIYPYSMPEHASHSPDGRFLIVVSICSCEIFDTFSRASVYGGESPHITPGTPTYSPDGLLICREDSGGIAILHANTFQVIQKLDFFAQQFFFLSDSDKLVVVVNEDVMLVDWKTGEQITTLSRVTSSRTNTALLSEFQIVGVSPDQREIKIWDLHAADCRHTIHCHDDEIHAIACSSDGKQIAGVLHFRVRLWVLSDTMGWMHKHDLTHPYAVECVAFSADSGIVVSGSYDHLIRIWDEAGVCIKVLKGHSHWINFLSVCQKTNQLVSGSNDGTLKLWDLSEILPANMRQRRSSSRQASDHCSQQSEETPCYGEANRIDDLVFSPSGHMLASLSPNGTNIWDTTTDECTQLLLSGGASGRGRISFTPDERLVAMSDTNDKLGIWDTALRAQIRFSEIEDPQHISLAADGQYVASISVSQVQSELSYQLKVWDLTKDCEATSTVTTETLPLEYDEEQSEVFVSSDDWGFIATSTIHNELEAIRRIPGHAAENVQSSLMGSPLAFSPDNEWLLVHEEIGDIFFLARMIDPYDSVQLGFVDDNELTYASTHLEDVVWQVPTRFGIVAVCNPDDFKIRHIGWGLSVEMDWIMQGNEPMLWVPVEYRRLAVDVNRARVAFVDPTGLLRIIRFR